MNNVTKCLFSRVFAYSKNIQNNLSQLTKEKLYLLKGFGPHFP